MSADNLSSDYQASEATGSETTLRPLASEQLLIEELPDVPSRRCLVFSPGRSQVASHLMQYRGAESVTAWYLDLYDAAVAGSSLGEKVHIVCSADPPADEVDLVAFPVMKRGEAELTRDLLQLAHGALAQDGVLVSAVDNPKDQWLHQQMQALFAKVTCVRGKRGCVYWGRKTSPLKKEKSFECEFAFRDEGRMIQIISRPGVFSHRRLDTGARQLMLASEIDENDNVLDMGCGAGAVALSAAFRTNGQVFGVDSNARAVACLEKGAAANGLANVHAILNADGQLDLPCAIDVALANPPYFGDDRISKHFVDSCVRVLRPGGALLVVTQSPGWYEEYFTTCLEDLTTFESSKYFVTCGRRPLR